MGLGERVVDVLLVGGGVASARCARTLRRRGFDGTILIIGEEERQPYNRPPLSKELLREDVPDELLAAEPRSFYERRGVALMTGRRVTALDADGQRALLDDGSAVRFERCLLATGAVVRRPSIPGADDALYLRTAADARALRTAAVAAGPGAEVAVVGGGFIGLEVASSLAAIGLRTLVLELSERLWGGTLGGELSSWAVDALERFGVSVRLGTSVDRIEADGAWVGDERYGAALVIVGVGVAPSTGLAEDAGLAVDDGILVDAGQRTSHAAIWAAGDAARVDGLRVEHWHAAREAGERAAMSMLALTVPDMPVPWVFSEIAGHTIDVFGATDGWDEERWLDDGRRALGFLRGGLLHGLATIDAVLPPEVGRALVAERVSASAVAARLA